MCNRIKSAKQIRCAKQYIGNSNMNKRRLLMTSWVLYIVYVAE